MPHQESKDSVEERTRGSRRAWRNSKPKSKENKIERSRAVRGSQRAQRRHQEYQLGDGRDQGIIGVLVMTTGYTNPQTRKLGGCASGSSCGTSEVKL